MPSFKCPMPYVFAMAVAETMIKIFVDIIVVWYWGGLAQALLNSIQGNVGSLEVSLLFYNLNKETEMNKADLIDYMAEEAKITKEKAGIALNALIEGVQEALQAKDGKLQLTGFGTFSTVHRKERKGRNPGTGEEITIPAQNSVKFKPGKKLKDAVE